VNTPELKWEPENALVLLYEKKLRRPRDAAAAEKVSRSPPAAADRPRTSRARPWRWLVVNRLRGLIRGWRPGKGRGRLGEARRAFSLNSNQPASRLTTSIARALALDVLGDDQQRPADLRHLLQQRQHLGGRSPASSRRQTSAFSAPTSAPACSPRSTARCTPCRTASPRRTQPSSRRSCPPRRDDRRPCLTFSKAWPSASRSSGRCSPRCWRRAASLLAVSFL